MSSNISEDIAQQGQRGENAFREWLQKSNAPYLYVEQSYENYSTLFKNKIKRPDFLLLVFGMGLLAVDVKHFKRSRSGGFTIDVEKDLKFTMEFEQAFKLYLWYAIKDVNSNDGKWYFISAYDAIQHGDLKKNKAKGSRFVHIDRKHFTELSNAERIDKLFRRRLGFSGMFTRRLEQLFRGLPELVND